MRMRFWILLASAVVVSCSSLSENAATQPTPTPAVAIAATLVPTPTAQPPPVAPATAARPAAATATPAARVIPPTRPGVQALSLRVDSPADEAIVSTNSLSVSGVTAPGAVVSVNGKLANVNQTGAFQYTLALVEGPNVIEIVASDANGSEMSSILSVDYEPNGQ